MSVCLSVSVYNVMRTLCVALCAIQGLAIGMAYGESTAGRVTRHT